MLQPWQALRSWFAGVGSDPYYANYDRSLGNIKAELDRIQASRAARLKAWAAIRARFLGWFAAAYAAVLAFAAYVNQQPQGTYRPSQQATRVSPVFLGPPLGWLAFKLLGWLQAVLDARSARRVRLLEGKLRKQVAELKDSTRYDRTLALLQKYDPDYAPPKPLRPSSARRGGQLPVNAVAGGSVSAGQGAMVSRAAGAAANAAGSALQGAGGVMFPALAQLYSRAAESLIADDPVMLGVLRDAQTQADQLRHRLAEYEARHTRQLHEICSLKQQLGLPTEEEEAALTAWAEHSGAAGAPVQAAAMPTSPATQQAGDGEQGDGGAGQPASPGLASSPELEPHTAGQPEASEGDPAGAGGSLSRVTRKKRGGSSGGAA